MEFKGTKGEWVSMILDISDFKQVCVGKDKGKAICHLWFEFDEGITEEVKANAKLISCAPEMLEMLIKAYENLNGYCPEKIFEEIEQLIKKATEI
jgi:hypothetical protein